MFGQYLHCNDVCPLSWMGAACDGCMFCVLGMLCVVKFAMEYDGEKVDRQEATML